MLCRKVSVRPKNHDIVAPDDQSQLPVKLEITTADNPKLL